MAEAMVKSLIISALVLAAAVPRHAAGQHAATTTQLSELLREAEQSRWHVRALLAPADTIEGRIVVVSPTELMIDAVRIAPGDILLLERRRADRGGVRHGALIGGALGLASGLLLFTPFAERFGTNPNELRLVATSTFVGAALGATIGGVLSIGQVRWQLIWAR